MTLSDFSDAELFSDAVQKTANSFGRMAELDADLHPSLILWKLLNKQLQQWEIITDFAAIKGLPGLVDVLTLFCKSLTELLAEKQWLTEQDWEYLDDWYSYAPLFFSHLTRDEYAMQWVACLQNLEAEDAEELTASLLDDAKVLGVEEEEDLSKISEIKLSEIKTEPLSKVPVQVKLVNLISTEYSFFVQELAEEIDKGIAASSEAYQNALHNKANKFNNFQQACTTVGLIGLQKVFIHLQHNINVPFIADHDGILEAKLFKSTLLLIQDYLDHVHDLSKAQLLCSFLQMDGWREPLSATFAEQWGDLLTVEVDDHQAQIQRIVVTDQDISLAIAEDVNSDLLDSMFHELPILTENFFNAIQNIVSENANSDYLLEAQRIAHTLKGTASMVGIAGISTLTHALEDILEKLTESAQMPPKILGEVLLESADCLQSMSEALRGVGEVPVNSLAIVQSVLDWNYQIEKEGIPEDGSALIMLTEESQNQQRAITETTLTEVQQHDTQQSDAKIAISSVLIDRLMQLTGEQGVINEQLKGKTNTLTKDTKNIRHMTWQLHELSSEIDRLINIQNYAVQQNGLKTTEFDALEMDQYNEFHNYVNRLAEVAADIRELNGVMSRELNDLKTLLIENSALQKANLDTVQQIRLMPAQKIISRCQRIVRQTAKMLAKEVVLIIEGEQTLIDNETLNNLIEPLMHLLRNSVDHGIESKEIRKNRGKTEQGHITLVFSKHGNFVHIRCADDGGGLDRDKIISTAVSKGLIDVSASEHLSDNEISRLILTPGFSTREITTQVSGRGIGMDVIHSQVKAMKGIMEINSTPQIGIKIDITLPLLLAATQSILVKVGDTVFAISEYGVKQIFSAIDSQITENNGQLAYQYEGQDYASEQLSSLLRLPSTGALHKPALLIEDRTGKQTALLVDAVLGTQDLILKSLGEYVPNIPGILGAAILGSGEVATVLDAHELLSMQHELHFDLNQLAAIESITTLSKALVVDDSLSARKAAAQLMMDNGFEVETAIDGLDALDKLDKTTPDILLLDMEMPRMNGIELTTHVRSRDDIGSIPIIMITSRSTEKHREQAKQAGVNKYLIKPFTDDDLMAAVNEVLANAAMLV